MASDQKKLRKISEHSLNLITDIRDRYVRNYHLETTKWDDSLKQLYFLNCDTEIIRFLEKNEIEANRSAISFGLSYGILILKNQIIFNYNKKYSNTVNNIEVKDRMFEDINTAVRDFLIYGV